MNTKRILGAVCASILASSIGSLAACGGTSDKGEVSTAKAVETASVSIALLDASGNKVGDGSGVLIAPRLVLTSAHLIAGQSRWVVTSADGKVKVSGSRGLTYDWQSYDSNKAHPRRNDVGVIHLDDAIKLDAYPKVLSDRSADGTKALRVRGTGGGFQMLDASLSRVRSAPNSYLADWSAGETLDTGGAVWDARGIIGIVSGRGLTTNKLYIARTDRLAQWLAPKIACAGGALAVRNYAPAAPKEEICEDGGVASSSSGSSGSPGGNTGPGGGPGAPGGGPGDSCSGDNDGICSGNCGPGSNTGGSDQSNGSPGSSSGAPGSSSGTPGSSSGSNPSTSSSSGDNPSTSSSSGDNPSGTPGTPGSSSGSDGSENPGSKGNNGVGNGQDGQPPGNPPINDGPGTGPGNPGNKGGPDGDVCQGADDNPDVCPPEPDGCVGPACGGGAPDDAIDYGNCACRGNSGGGGIYLR
mgnify:CR=1 FL=1